MKKYNGYWMYKITRVDIGIKDEDGNRVPVSKSPRTYKEAMAIIDSLAN